LSRENELATNQTDVEQTISGSITFALSGDTRDNPLTPRRGMRWYGQIEVADEVLGGETGFQRIELGFSWHRPLTDTSWLHLGLSHRTVLTLGESNDLNLPANKRFFPGGEH